MGQRLCGSKVMWASKCELMDMMVTRQVNNLGTMHFIVDLQLNFLR